jgi:hypothetical protein
MTAIAAPRWIEVDPSKLLDSVPLEADLSSGFHVTPSPYDIPLAIRISGDAIEGRFGIELRYLSGADEPLRSESLADGVELAIGTRSGRVHAMTVAQRVALSFGVPTLQPLVDALTAGGRAKGGRALNYKLVRHCLVKYEQQIIAELAGAQEQRHSSAPRPRLRIFDESWPGYIPE